MARLRRGGPARVASNRRCVAQSPILGDDPLSDGDHDEAEIMHALPALLTTGGRPTTAGGQKG
eukprot:4126663-Prymnesium_polylepis.1